MVEWLGFKRHLLVDVQHEVSLAYKTTGTKAGDGKLMMTCAYGERRARLR